MSVTTSPPRMTLSRLTQARSLALSADAVALLALAGWCLALVVLTWGTWGDLGRDTGYDLVAGSRVADGELPYRDFVYFYGPAAPLLLGGVYAVAGAGMGPTLAVGFAIVAVILAETYLLGRRLAGPLGGGLAAALAAVAAFGTGNNSFVLPHSTSAPLAVAFALGVLLALLAHASGGRRRWLVVGGTAAGLVVLSRPETSLSVGATVAAWSLLRVLLAPAGRGAAVKDAIALLAPAALLPLLGYAAFAASAGASDLLWQNLYPRDMLEAGGNTVLRGQAPLTAESFAVLGGRAVLWASAVIGLAALGAVAARVRAVRLLVWAGAAFTLLVVVAVALARPETVRYYLQFAFAWIPIGAWLTVGGLAWQARRRGLGWTADEMGPLLVAFMLAVASSTAYGAFYPHPRPNGPQATTYLIPLIGVFLAWLHVRLLPRSVPGSAGPVTALGAALVAALVLACGSLVVGDARDETVTVHAQHGQLTAAASEAGAFQGAIDEIERRTRPGDPILVAPQLASLYVLTGRTDPLPQISLLPGTLATPADEEAAIARMDDVRLAVIDGRPLRQYGHGTFGETFSERVGAWLQREFTEVATVRGAGEKPRELVIWERRGT
jgi:hypothetical protein